jgi:hypothetical protein
MASAWLRPCDVLNTAFFTEWTLFISLYSLPLSPCRLRIRKCSLFIPGVGTEEKQIEKRKNNLSPFRSTIFFPTQLLHDLDFYFTQPNFKIIQVFYIYTYILLYKLGHYSINSTVYIWCTNWMSNIIICTFTSSYYVPKPPSSCSPTISRCCNQRRWGVGV